MRYRHYETETVSSKFLSAGRMDCLLYENRDVTKRKPIGIVVMHSDSNYLDFSAGIEFAERGFTVLSVNVEGDGDLGMKLGGLADCVKTLRKQSAVEKVVLFGHSGGATLMSCYQAVAENGIEFFQGENMIVSFGRMPFPLEPADGVMLIDPNWGNGAMMLFSLDPAVIDEENGMARDPELDIFNPANGFDPKGSHYSEEFIRKFQKAQGERNNRIIDAALERQALIRSGKGKLSDDEPFMVIGGASGFRNNKLYAQDISLMSRTRQPHTLIHGDGSVTNEVIKTVRPPQNDRCFTDSMREGALITTVNTFLSSHCVRTTADYGYDEDTVRGVDWESSYCCTTGNVRGVHVPLLVMGMTAGWEFACAETVYEMAGSEDKTVAFVEGATHMFAPADPSYGDTMKATYDYAASWLDEAGRF